MTGIIISAVGMLLSMLGVSYFNEHGEGPQFLIHLALSLLLVVVMALSLVFCLGFYLGGR